MALLRGERSSPQIFVCRQLQTIHEVIGSAFKATVTKHALKVWNEK